MVNSQVISEFVTVTIKKQILSIADAFKYAGEFMDIFEFSIIKKETIKLSFELMTKHKYSYWDSLIIDPHVLRTLFIWLSRRLKRRLRP